MTPLLGFTPDAPPATPSIMVDCFNIVPTVRGFEAARLPNPVAGGTLGSQARGAAVTVNTAGTKRILAATQTGIYEFSGSSWTDRSRGGGYTGSSENRVMFAQFGNAALATNLSEPIQASTSGAFADIAGAPKARIIVAAQNFVIAFNTNDGVFGASPDRWWCSAFQDHTGWTVGTNQSNTGRLIGEGGEITAAARLGQYVVAYKAANLFLGTYAGSPIIWQWDQIPGEVGCVGPEAVDDVGGAHVFVGRDNIWLFDGTRPVSIALGQVRDWFLGNSSAKYRYRTIVRADRFSNRVWIFFPSTVSTGQCDTALVYHLLTKQWGKLVTSVEAAFVYNSPGLTIDGLDAFASTIDTLPDIPMDSQTWQADGRTLAVFNTSHQLAPMETPAAISYITTGDYGDDAAASYAYALRPRFVTIPASASVLGLTATTAGGALTPNGSATLYDGKFDIRQTGRWHRFLISLSGNHEILGIGVSLKPAGVR